jgi:hypothetical protein
LKRDALFEIGAAGPSDTRTAFLSNRWNRTMRKMLAFAAAAIDADLRRNAHTVLIYQTPPG